LPILVRFQSRLRIKLDPIFTQSYWAGKFTAEESLRQETSVSNAMVYNRVAKRFLNIFIAYDPFLS
jgi:hypothetical protein